MINWRSMLLPKSVSGASPVLPDKPLIRLRKADWLSFGSLRNSGLTLVSKVISAVGFPPNITFEGPLYPFPMPAYPP